MRYGPSRRLGKGILAALLVLGMSLSTAGAGLLPTPMVIAIGADVARPDCCNDGGDAGDPAMGACLLVCLACAQAVLPGDVMAMVGRSGQVGAIAPFSLDARTVHPDPHPPRGFLLD